MQRAIAFDDPRRLEWMQAVLLDGFMTAARRMRVSIPNAALAVAGGVAAFFGVGNPTTVARGLALGEPIDADEFATLVDFYRSRQSEVRVEAGAYTHRSLRELLASNRAKPALTSRMYVMQLTRAAARASEPAQGVRVEEVDETTAQAYFDVVGRGFNEGQPTPPEFRFHGPVSLSMSRGGSFLASVDGRPAGGGRVSWVDVPRERGGGRVALFSGGATRPDLRRRGVHAALLEARVAQALAVGCDTACVLCTPDSASERNIARSGFSLTYSRELLGFE